MVYLTFSPVSGCNPVGLFGKSPFYKLKDIIALRHLTQARGCIAIFNVCLCLMGSILGWTEL